MKILVAYSSKTGNTRNVATAVAEGLGPETRLASVAEASDWASHDLVAIGFWIDRGRPDKEAARFMKQVKGKKLALFFTLGADPDSEHAGHALDAAKALVRENELVGSFVCQGRIDPALKAWMQKLPSWFPHGPNPERIARWERAESHPDNEDLARARDAARGWLKLVTMTQR